MRGKALLCVLLLFILCLPALASTYTAQGRFSFAYPDHWTHDDLSYTSDSTRDYTWLVDVSGDHMYMVVSIEKIDGWDGFSLFSASAAEASDYKRDLLGDLKAYGGQYVDTWYEASERIPFMILKLTQDGVEYLEAVTIAGGNEIRFSLSPDGGAIDEAVTARLKAVVASFVPVS